MTDTIIQAIGAGVINPGNISFDLIKNTAGVNRDLWDELGRGRSILSSYDQLDQYLYSYGPMIKSQWSKFLEDVTIFNGGIRIIDYGCGQGLAFILLFDHFGSEVASRVKEAILIEPSVLALARAKSVFVCFCGTSAVFDINKKLDDLAPQELGPSNGLSTVHLFSNVLDINDFNHDVLLGKILQTKGKHFILAVSHDRNFQGGSARFVAAENFITSAQGSNFVINTSVIEKFTCSTGQTAISWQLYLDVVNGPL